MSFRTRLTLFFVVIVIVPMAAVGVVVFHLIADNEAGKADARLAEDQRAARGLYRSLTARGDVAAREVSGDARLASALRRGDAGGARRRARALIARARLSRLRIDRDGRVLVDVGDRAAIAPARKDLISGDGQRLGRLEVSTATASGYLSTLRRFGLTVVVRDGDRTLAGPAVGRLPTVGTVKTGDRPLRAATFTAPGFAGPLRVAVVASRAPTSSAVGRSRLLVGLVLAGFFIVACLFALAVSRALQAQIGRFLAAARRLGAGDFSLPAPTDGHDEFAALGHEFNKMSSELERRLEQLHQERSRLEGSIRRIGETFASNLDRAALLELGARTAIDAVQADGGRVSVCDAADGAFHERLRLGAVGGREDALSVAEAQALGSGALVDAQTGDVHALAAPLRRSAGEGGTRGLIAVARAERAFTDGERDLFGYLAGQAAISLENVALHEQVQREAVTDELTGLFNLRRFHEVIGLEVERARRFGDDLGLVMLDVDDFKRVNDALGHQQGDAVLRSVAAVLRETSREIDVPARYGGEEMAVVLPQTGLDGAHRLADRVREAVESLAVPRLDGQGVVRVTVSCGAAAVGGETRSHEELIAAADAALYEAKRAGKNQTARSTPAVSRAVGAE